MSASPASAGKPAGASSIPVLPGFVVLHDPAKPNLVVCSLCSVKLPRATRNMQEHAASATHQTAISKQSAQQTPHTTPQKHDSPASAAASFSVASPSTVLPSQCSSLDDTELQMQLLALRQKFALEKLKLEQEMEQLKLRQLIMEKKQAEEEAAINAKLAALRMPPATPQPAGSKGGAGVGASPPPSVSTPPRVVPPASSAAASSLFLTPNPVPRASAPAASASAPTAPAATAAAAPTGRYSTPGLYPSVLVGVLCKWKSPIFGVINVPAEQGIDGQTVFHFHLNQLASGVDRAMLPVGSHVQFQIWVKTVDGVLKKFASCVQPAGGEGQPAAVSSSAASAVSSALSSVGSVTLPPGVHGRLFGKLHSPANPRGLILLPEHNTINGTREVQVHESQLRSTVAVGSSVSFQLFVNPALKLFANEVREEPQVGAAAASSSSFTSQPAHIDVGSGHNGGYPSTPPKGPGAGAGAAMTPLATPLSIVRKSSTPGGPASPDASTSVVSPAAAPPSADSLLSSAAQLAEVERALRSLMASTGKESLDLGAVVPCITQRYPNFKQSLGEDGWTGLWKRAQEAGVAEVVILPGPKGPDIRRLRLMPMRGELVELHTTLEAMAAQMGRDTFDISAVADCLNKRLPLFKQSLPAGGWMGLWNRAHAAGTVTLLTSQSHTGADCHKLKRVPELKELQTAMDLIAERSGGESFDQASVAEWMGKRNPKLKAQFAGKWLNLWKWADAAGVVKLETRLGPNGAKNFSLTRVRGPPHQLPTRSAPALTPQKSETSPATSLQSTAISSASAQIPIATPPKPEESVAASGSVQAASPQSLDPAAELAQLRLRRQQRLEEAMRREEELMRLEEEEMSRQPQSEANGNAAAAADDCEARRIEAEQAEIEAAFAALSATSDAEVAQPAPLTQWTSLASSLAEHPMAPLPSASSSSSSSPPMAGLLRGTFLRWFDETYGVVGHEGKDLLVHVDQIFCEARDLKRGCAVQFVIHHGANRDYAEAVQPLGWSPSAGLEPGYTRGVISHWVDDTHGLIRARIHGQQRELVMFHANQLAAGVSKEDLTDHTKVTFKVFQTAHNGKCFANDVRPLKPPPADSAINAEAAQEEDGVESRDEDIDEEES